MDFLIRQLSQYGAITIEREYDYWHVGCVVHNPDYTEESYVKVTSEKLYFAFKELLIKVKDEYKKLILRPHIEQRLLLQEVTQQKV